VGVAWPRGRSRVYSQLRELVASGQARALRGRPARWELVSGRPHLEVLR